MKGQRKNIPEPTSLWYFPNRKIIASSHSLLIATVKIAMKRNRNIGNISMKDHKFGKYKKNVTTEITNNKKNTIKGVGELRYGSFSGIFLYFSFISLKD